MAGGNVKYPKAMRDKAKAESRCLATIAVEDRRIIAEFQFYCNESATTFLISFAATLSKEKDIEKAIEAGRAAVVAQVAEDTAKALKSEAKSWRTGKRNHVAF